MIFSMVRKYIPGLLESDFIKDLFSNYSLSYIKLFVYTIEMLFFFKFSNLNANLYYRIKCFKF